MLQYPFPLNSLLHGFNYLSPTPHLPFPHIHLYTHTHNHSLSKLLLQGSRNTSSMTIQYSLFSLLLLELPFVCVLLNHTILIGYLFYFGFHDTTPLLLFQFLLTFFLAAFPGSLFLSAFSNICVPIYI